MNNLLAQFDDFLIDLWGVIWDEEKVYPGAADFCRRLLDQGKRLCFLSNCAEHLPESMAVRFREAGLAEIDERFIATSGQAMAPWFRLNGLAGRRVYTFGNEALCENVRRAGAEPIDLPEDPLAVRDEPQSDCLVLGGHYVFTWRRLGDVASAVRLADLRVLLPNPDRVVTNQEGVIHFPAGMIAHVIETALPSARIERIGKPYPFIYDFAMERFGQGARRERTLMIGDSLETDILGANRSNIPSLLIGQGVHSHDSPEQIRALAKACGAKPDFYASELSLQAVCRPFEAD